ncbi:protein-glutamine gamma-glutamyltransferase [Paenibacillus sp. GCM10023252]|uniref:protein-glutamine gamma-glutamyltransferase n=1 Tax=Paenibacillus sp. GCM10023252 TaxID=3252649 RepID=UPI0036213DAB
MSFESTLRMNIMEAARDMSKGGTRFATFRTSECNARYWHLTNKGGFLLREGIAPAKGIRNIYSQGKRYAFECAVAIVIIFYKAVLDTIGEKSFNTLFPNLLLYSWDADSDLGLSTRYVPYNYAVPGDVLYFRNPDVDRDTTEWQGENVIKLGKDLYYGHGLGIRNADAMIKALNRHRIEGSERSAYLDNQITAPDYRYLSRYASR